MREVVEQIQSKKKAKNKLAQWFATAGIIYPPTLSMEQCSSEATAVYKASLVEGESMADLTGGMGVDTFYLSRSFRLTHYVEKQEQLASLASHNFRQLGLSAVKVHNLDAMTFLQNLEEKADLIYLDPARRGVHNSKVVRFQDCEPDIVHLLPVLKKKSGAILIKSSPMLDIKLAINELGGVTEVHVLADRNEVKELLFLIDKEATVNPKIYAVNLTLDGVEKFVFDYQSESDTLPQIGTVSNWLYEPNVAILKAGGFKSVIDKFPTLLKLHPNTHLYTSTELINSFPGRSFRVIGSLQMNRKQLRKKLPDMTANISVRNFPMSVEQIRRKTALKEGGNQYAFGLTDMEGPKLLLLRKASHE